MGTGDSGNEGRVSPAVTVVGPDGHSLVTTRREALPPCKHCKEVRGTIRRRGLCPPCYYGKANQEGYREEYPPLRDVLDLPGPPCEKRSPTTPEERQKRKLQRVHRALWKQEKARKQAERKRRAVRDGGVTTEEGTTMANEKRGTEVIVKEGARRDDGREGNPIGARAAETIVSPLAAKTEDMSALWYRRGEEVAAEPTRAMPGTEAKIRVLAERAALGLSLWHPRDAGFGGTIGTDFKLNQERYLTTRGGSNYGPK